MLYKEVKQDTPRLVVKFGKAANGDDVFDWGAVGFIPLMALTGAVSRVQHVLCSSGWLPECPEPALVIAQDGSTGELCCFVHPDAPGDPLVGMLEFIKSTLVSNLAMQHAAAQVKRRQVVGPQPGLMGPDGRPIGG